nr:DUF2281 domain-containing protein [uncultured Arsenicibacter sp.]
MLTTIEAIYEDGKIIWEETPPATKRAKVIVTFLEESNLITSDKPSSKKRVGGSLKGKIQIPDDFNKPLDDLKEYMY